MTCTFGKGIPVLFALSATIGVIPARHTGNHPIAGPAGLPLSDWQQIRALYEKHRHAAVLVEGEYRARNQRQQWLTRFDGRGFTVTPDEGGWSWGLELAGHGDRAKISAKDERVVYRWSAQVEEWFVNDQRGLEHGFTIRSRMAGPLRLRVRGGHEPRVEPNRRGIRFGEAVKYDGLTAWDADGKLLPAHFDATAAEIRIQIDDRGARYPVTIDPIVQQAYLKASNTGSNDFFGSSVAISGATAVVGAYGEDGPANSEETSGAAYVFVRSGGVWSQQAYLRASNSDAGDGFGSSVAISGNTIVVGAPFEDSDGTGVNSGRQSNNSVLNCGAAYVFVRSGGVWSQQAYLKDTNSPQTFEEFGAAVAISGDTVVVGARKETSILFLSGAAHVFHRVNATWSAQAYLQGSNTEPGDSIGHSVAISGDTIVVGAPEEDSNATGVNGNQANNSAEVSGAAYVFTRSGSAWSQQAYLKASNTEALDYFGGSVAISGDTIVVGARWEDSNATGVNGNQASNGASNSGAAYVFTRTNGAWSQQAYLKASNTGVEDHFGHSVGISGDTIIAGAINEDSSATGVDGNQGDETAMSSGAVYVFARAGGSWSQRAYLKASNTGPGDLFGFSGGISGDTAVVGAASEASNATGVNGNQSNNSATQAGAAYAFTVDAGPLLSNAGIFRGGFFWLQDVNGDRLFTTPPDRAFAFGGVAGDIPITGDWNGNGVTKVGVYRPVNGLFVLDFDGDGQFTAADKAYDLGVGVQAGDRPVVGDWNGSGTSKVGLFRQGFLWILDTNGNGVFQQGVEQAFAFGGVAGDVPLVGDWDGDGRSNLGLFRFGFFWILDVNGNGAIDSVNQPNGDKAFAFGGVAGDVPLAGDWNGDGKSKVGVFRAGFFWVLDANGNTTFDGTGPGQDLAFAFGGLPNDKPVVGRW